MINYINFISIRLFTALPSSVSFEAIGLVSPFPLVSIIFSGARPNSINFSSTLSALLNDNSLLYSLVPLESVYPVIEIL